MTYSFSVRARFVMALMFAPLSVQAANDVAAPSVIQPASPVDSRFQRDAAASSVRDEEPQTQVPAVDEIERRLMRMTMRWGRLRVARGDGPLDLGFFNQRAPYVFADTPQGQKAANASYDFRVAQFMTGIFAGAVYIADFAYVAARLGSNEHPWDKTDTAVSLGMLAGGLALDVTSYLLGSAANDRLAKAVNYENEHVVVHTLRPLPRARAGVIPLPRGGALAAATFSF